MITASSDLRRTFTGAYYVAPNVRRAPQLQDSKA